MAENIYLMHHAPAFRRPHEIIGCGTDRDLDDYGISIAKLQAERLTRVLDAGLIKSIGSTLISSPLKRAVQSAEIIAASLDFSIQVDQRFTAQDFGILEGLTFDEIKKDPKLAMNLWDHIPPDLRTEHRVPEGESNGDFVRRINSARIDIFDCSNDNPIIITHGSVIDAVISQHRSARLDEVEGVNRKYEGRVIEDSMDGYRPLGQQGEQFSHIPGVSQLIPNRDVNGIKRAINAHILYGGVSADEQTHLTKLMGFLD